MKILLYGLNFAPEPIGIGKYSGEMAAWLAEAGNEVRVIAAPPYYPAWAISAGYSRIGTTSEMWRGVRVTRAPLWVPSKPTGLKRVLHLMSFAVLSLPALIRHGFWRPDAVFVIAPAFACAPAGWLMARLCGAKAWLHIQDFEIDTAFQLGLLKGRGIQRALGICERWLLRRFDRVSTISNRMVDVLRAKGVESARAVYFPNWVDVNAIRPSGERGTYRAELGIAEDAIVALYSGSMACKQGLELLPAAARALALRLPNLVFVLCGDGMGRPALERDCAGLTNVRLLPLQPASRLSELLGMADVHLLPQQAGAADLVMPSKLTGMLSSGRAVLATAPLGTELAHVLTDIGLVVPPNDLTSFGQALVTLTESAELRAHLGAAGRRYAEDRLARDRILIDVEQALKRCVGASVVAPAKPVPSSSSPDEKVTPV